MIHKINNKINNKKIFLYLIATIIGFIWIQNNKNNENNEKKDYVILLNKIIYIKNVLSFEEFSKLKEECLPLFSKLTPDKHAGTNRAHVILCKDGPIEQIFYSKHFLEYMKNILGVNNIQPSKVLPIEFRYYEAGSSMDWHRDTIVNIRNKMPQVEVVFTLHNSSDSKTEWIDDETGELHKVFSTPNSIMITQGGGCFHQVTPITVGDRSIIKIAYDIVA